jgi:Tfx family DNA-binding protein
MSTGIGCPGNRQAVDGMGRTGNGLLSARQVEVLKRRRRGMTLEAIAARLRSTRQNVAQLEKRARRNVLLAERTLHAHDRAVCAGALTIPAGTRKVDIPGLVLTEGDRRKVHVGANFMSLYYDLNNKVPECLSRTHVVAPIEIFILADGRLAVYSVEAGKGVVPGRRTRRGDERAAQP